MKKKYLFKPVLTLLFTVFIFSQTYAQVRIVQVDPSTEAVTIHNYGGSTVDISSYWFCQWPSYNIVSGMSINSGSTMLASGADVTITSSVNFGATDGEFGLYTTNATGFTSGMIDYLEWGSSGHTRESVAVTAGVWAAGTFISAAPPFQYTGDGTISPTGVGVAFWETVLGIEDFENNITFTISPNPTASILNLRSNNFINGNINIFDMLGKQVISQEINANNQVQIDVSNISKGLYLVKVSSGENTQTKRFIKQ